MTVSNRPGTSYDIVIVGAGSAGIATASSLLKRNRSLRIALIDPSPDHYYQPGWTMVGGGIFEPESTHRKTADLIPAGVDWIAQSVTGFAPDDNSVTLDNNVSFISRHLVVAPGLKLDWAAVEGLEETLGKNGVTSNYRYDLAPYTRQLVQGLHRGKALFTQPPMPIECAGAPQKALYLSGDGGWLEVDPASLQHKRYPYIWGAGDVMDTANAKTMMAAAPARSRLRMASGAKINSH